MKWWFRFNSSFLLGGLLGAFGKDAQKDAEEVAEEQALGMCVVFVVLAICGLTYFIAKALGIVK